tara:strand:+ start:154 stop:405 length:252 start_codon:yes stop_codon:yes gene_type:complete
MRPEEASQVQFNTLELQHLERIGSHAIEGSPSIVKEKIIETAEAYHTDDISIVTNCYYFEDRVRSFELIAKAFELATEQSAIS